MTMLGLRMAERILGAETAGPFERSSFPTRPFYRGDPTIALRLIGANLKFRDWIERKRTAISSSLSGK